MPFPDWRRDQDSDNMRQKFSIFYSKPVYQANVLNSSVHISNMIIL